MSSILTAARFSLLIFLTGGIVYPLTMTALGELFFPSQANGSLIKQADGQIIGSRLIGQNFTHPEYFHPRPAVNGYDASNSGGSNLGAASKKLINRINQNASVYQKDNLNIRTKQSIPVDAVTASASNLDPHISLANALLQASRVAQSRGLRQESVTALIKQLAEKPLLAESPYTNVLRVNLALDRQQRRKTR